MQRPARAASPRGRRGRRPRACRARPARTTAAPAPGSRGARRRRAPRRGESRSRLAGCAAPVPRPGRRKRARFSARSMLVERRAQDAARPPRAAPRASLSGVWPPSWTITPIGFSTSMTLSTSSSGERLEVQPASRCRSRCDTVSGFELIEHDLVAALLERLERRLHAAVVELDPLPDAVGPAAQDDARAARCRAGDLVLLLVGRVEVRRLAPRTRRRRCPPPSSPARMPVRQAQRAAPRPRSSPTSAPSARSEKPSRLARAQRARASPPRGRAQLAPARPRVSVMRFIWCRNHGSMPVGSAASLGRLARRPARGTAAQPLPVRAQQCSRSVRAAPRARPGRRRARAAMPMPRLERAQPLEQRLGERAADRHDLAHRLHAGAEPAVGGAELLERPARDLDHAVVERRLEARRRLLGDVVGDLVERVGRPPAAPRSWRSGSRSPCSPAPSCARRAGSSR